MKFIIFFLLLAFATGFAQDDSIKKMFTGKWKMDSEKSEMYEEWTIVNDTELTATSYSVNNGESFISEHIYLKKIADYWAYIAVPKGQSPTMFTLLEFTDNKFIFENKEHDFPQRVIYEFNDNGKLTASIEGEINGELKRKEFHFTLVKN
jgi:hypothetical protein